MERKEPRKCRQCGFKIIDIGMFHRDYGAQDRGFCSTGCEETYNAIMEDLKHEAEKDLANG